MPLKGKKLKKEIKKQQEANKIIRGQARTIGQARKVESAKRRAIIRRKEGYR